MVVALTERERDVKERTRHGTPEERPHCQPLCPRAVPPAPLRCLHRPICDLGRITVLTVTVSKALVLFF